MALALVMGFTNLTGDLVNDDEETYLYDAWRVSLGETPYADFLVVQTPLSFYLAAALFKIFGPSVWWARALSYAFVLGAAGLIFLASRRFFKFDRAVALAGAAVFLFSKHVYFLGRLFMPDTAMVFFATAALYFGLKAETVAEPRQRGRFVFFFGALTGFAALAKLNAILVFIGYVIFCLVLALRKRGIRRAAVERLIFSTAGCLASFGLLFGLMIMFVPPTLGATLGVHAAKLKIAGSAAVLAWIGRLAQVVGNHNYGLIPVALFGIGTHPPTRDTKRLLLLILTLMTLGQVFLPVAFFPRYVVFALVPLAFFFEDGLVALLALKKGRAFALAAAGALVLLCLAPSFNPKKLLARERGTRSVAAYVERHTGPNDYIFGETPFANFYARRPCPPQLVDVSEARTASGQVTSADIRRECDRYRVKMILIEKGAAHHLSSLRDYSDFEAYLNETYDFATSLLRGFLRVEIYIRKNKR